MNTVQDTLTPNGYFSSMIYTIKKPEFLDKTITVCNELLDAAKKIQPINETYPSIMSGSMIGILDLHSLEKFIAESSWLILDSQGYRMDDFLAYVSEFWVQEHFKYSGLEQHIHSHNVVISGFYFLETPDNGCMIELHDPRAGKVQASLPFKDLSQVKEANNSLYIKPEKGLIVFSNSWLPHSFTRNSSAESVKFIHFNVSVKQSEIVAAPIVI